MVVVSSSVVHQSKGLCDPPYSFKVVVTSCCNWTEVLSGLYISSGLLNAHQGKEKPYKSV